VVIDVEAPAAASAHVTSDETHPVAENPHSLTSKPLQNVSGEFLSTCLRQSQSRASAMFTFIKYFGTLWTVCEDEDVGLVGLGLGLGLVLR